MIGHKELIRDFKKLADLGQLAHGYIFFGSSRVGKATFALSFAHYLEAKDFSWPTEQPVLGDVLHIKPNSHERTIGIDAVRAIRGFLAHAPNRSALRTVILDEAELLTSEAENALLKIAEEPNPRAMIIVIIDDPERLLPTLRSRLQRIHFGAVPEKEITTWLTETYDVPKTAAQAAAQASRGVPGLAWTFIHDTQFIEMRKSVEDFFRATGFARSAFLKELVADESFHFDKFLEVMTFVLANDEARLRKEPEFWHQLMELRRNENYFNLNPRLQLSALAQYITNS